MNGTLLNNTQNDKRYVFALIVTVMVLLTSCPIKSGIKSLMGIPVSTEQGATTSNTNFLINGGERCVNSETDQTKTSSTVSTRANDILPTVILTSIFLFLIGYTLKRKHVHPLYGNLKIPDTLPIFLRYRKLII
ncbi:hypothetical protein RYH73_16320 [Olivibacter sp. CPCC 100613]|uniref:hypothetical protein n=1 Tax=Olivibacter sp. CPCC 100613 TaxID=3079931 RepID=UPI002FF93D88